MGVGLGARLGGLGEYTVGIRVKMGGEDKCGIGTAFQFFVCKVPSSVALSTSRCKAVVIATSSITVLQCSNARIRKDLKVIETGLRLV